MKRRTLLSTIAGLVVAAFGLSCSKNVNLDKNFFKRDNVIGDDIEGNYYLKYKFDEIFVAIKIDSTKINQYKPGNYKLDWYNQYYLWENEKLQVYILEEKK